MYVYVCIQDIDTGSGTDTNINVETHTHKHTNTCTYAASIKNCSFVHACMCVSNIHVHVTIKRFFWEFSRNGGSVMMMAHIYSVAGLRGGVTLPCASMRSNMCMCTHACIQHVCTGISASVHKYFSMYAHVSQHACTGILKLTCSGGATSGSLHAFTGEYLRLGPRSCCPRARNALSSSCREDNLAVGGVVDVEPGVCQSAVCVNACMQ
jgi:hypothetical protein